MPAWVCPAYNKWSDVDDIVTLNTTKWSQIRGLNMTWRDVPLRTSNPEVWTPILDVYVNDVLDQWKPAQGIWVKQAGGWTPVVL